MKYLVILKISDGVAEFLNQLRKEIPTNYNFVISGLEPHITVVPPFEVDFSEEKLLEILYNIRFKKFKISVRGLGCFEERTKAFYVNVLMNKFLMNLYIDLKDTLEPVSQSAGGKGSLFGLGFIPHVTIVKNLIAKEFLSIKEKMLSIDYQADWKVNSFWLYSRVEGQQWLPVCSVEGY